MLEAGRLRGMMEDMPGRVMDIGGGAVNMMDEGRGGGGSASICGVGGNARGAGVGAPRAQLGAMPVRSSGCCNAGSASTGFGRWIAPPQCMDAWSEDPVTVCRFS